MSAVSAKVSRTRASRGAGVSRRAVASLAAALLSTAVAASAAAPAGARVKLRAPQVSKPRVTRTLAPGEASTLQAACKWGFFLAAVKHEARVLENGSQTRLLNWKTDLAVHKSFTFRKGVQGAVFAVENISGTKTIAVRLRLICVKRAVIARLRGARAVALLGRIAVRKASAIVASGARGAVQPRCGARRVPLGFFAPEVVLFRVFEYLRKIAYTRFKIRFLVGNPSPSAEELAVAAVCLVRRARLYGPGARARGSGTGGAAVVAAARRPRARPRVIQVGRVFDVPPHANPETTASALTVRCPRRYVATSMAWNARDPQNASPQVFLRDADDRGRRAVTARVTNFGTASHRVFVGAICLTMRFSGF
jgi:hypothetical protein